MICSAETLLAPGILESLPESGVCEKKLLVLNSVLNNETIQGMNYYARETGIKILNKPSSC
jgi:hypothetical protein